MDVVCDRCNKEFTMKLKEKLYSKGRKEIYFICPNCKKRYTSYWTTNKVSKLQGDIKKLRLEKRQAALSYEIEKDYEYKRKIDEIDKDINIIQDKIKSEMDIISKK